MKIGMTVSDNLEKAGFVLESSWLAENRRGGRFSGIAYTDNAIIVGQEGYDKYVKGRKFDINDFREGRFCVVERTDSRLYARVDAFGQEAIFYFYNKDAWAISNSFLMLAEHLVDHGVKLTADVDSMYLGFVPGALGQSPISNDTYIREIKTLSAEFYIKVDFNFRPFVFSLEKTENLSNRGNVTEDDYVESVIDFTAKSVSRSLALLRDYKGRLRVDLTGGQDSRLMLGILEATGENLDEINFHSNKAWEDDYRVATELGNALGFKLKPKSVPISKSSVEQSYRLWKIGNVGVYLPVYAAIGDAPQSSLHFHGACGESYRDYYAASGNQLIKRVHASSSEKVAQAFARQLRRSFADMDEDIASPQSMMVHYRHFRSRFHFGRSAYKNLNARLVTPLASMDLINATRHLSLPKLKRFQLALDIFLLLNPKLAAISFDDVRKNFKDSEIKNSPFKKGAPEFKSKIQDLEVFRGDFGVAEKAPPADYSFKDYILQDLSNLSDAVNNAGIFPEGYQAEAATRIREGGRLTVDATYASHIISVAQVTNLIGDIQAKPVKLSSPKFRISDIAILSAHVENGKIFASFEIEDSKLIDQFEFAFYLISDGKREGLIWYSDNRSVKFDMASIKPGAKYRVNGFVRRKANPQKKWSVYADVT